MKNIVFIALVLVVVPAFAENLLVNPSFDTAPWDTGWTVEGEPGDGYISATPDTDIYYSSPRSCKLLAHTSWDEGAYIYFYQEIPRAKCCTCGVYFQYISGSSMWTHTAFAIYVKVNDEYVMEWYSVWESDTIWTNWEKIYDSNDTISGIKFYTDAWIGIHGAVAEGSLWIDDVYILGTKVGIEEKPEEGKSVFKVYPNPFTKTTTISFFSDRGTKHGHVSLRIYNLSGRLIHTFNHLTSQPVNQATWNAKGVPSGIYFAKLTAGDYKATKKLILMR